MPFYEYICEACGKDFVLLQSMTAKAEDTVCPYCNEKKAKNGFSSLRMVQASTQAAAPGVIPGAEAEAYKRSAGCRSSNFMEGLRVGMILRLFCAMRTSSKLGARNPK
jgi:putative FmdB family regulatory protein